MSSIRDTTARSRIRAYLRRHGPVEDPAGRATARLMAAVDYRGAPVAFIQLVTAMSKDAEIVRLVRGKRTYRITLAEPAAANGAAEPQPVPRAAMLGIDYDVLARRLLDALSQQAHAHPDSPAVPTAAEFARLRAERDRLRAECEGYTLLIEKARAELARLLGAPVSTQDWDPEVERTARGLLTGLRRGPDSGEQAG